MRTKSALHLTSRRRFLEAAGAAVALSRVPLASSRPTSDPERSFENGAPLQEVGYAQVSFQPGLHESQLQATHEVLMGLSEDTLLRPYRLHAGLAAPGCDLGGWYSDESLGPANFGQWVSALSRYYAITQDEASRAKVDRLVRAFAETVEPSGKLFGKTTDPTQGPAYHYDKLVCGLTDAHRFTMHPTALEVLARTTDAVIPAAAGQGQGFFLQRRGCQRELYDPGESVYRLAERRVGEALGVGKGVPERCVLRSPRARRECATGQARLQSRQFALLRGQGVPGPRRRSLPAGGQERLCLRRQAEFRHRGLGTERILRSVARSGRGGLSAHCIAER